MFNEDGTYAPPDTVTRHVAVTTDAFMVSAGGPHQFPVAAGTVTWIGMLGQTQVSHIGPQLPRAQGKIVGVLIEHETARLGDILPESEIAPAAALAEKKQAAVKAYWVAQGIPIR